MEDCKADLARRQLQPVHAGYVHVQSRAKGAATSAGNCQIVKES